MRIHEEQRQTVIFLAGFLVGVLYIYFTGSYREGNTDFLSIQNLMQVMYMEIVHKDYFVFLLKKRLGVIFALAVASLALPGRYLLLGFLMVFGCSMGSMFSVLVIRYGIKGALLFMGLIFPQYIVYIPVVFQWVCLLSDWHEGVFYGRNPLMRKRVSGLHFAARTMVLLTVTIIGIFLECYVNPVIVNWCLKIF